MIDLILTWVSVVTKSSFSLVYYFLSQICIHTTHLHTQLKVTLLFNYEFSVSRISIFFIRSIMFIYRNKFSFGISITKTIWMIDFYIGYCYFIYIFIQLWKKKTVDPSIFNVTVNTFLTWLGVWDSLRQVEITCSPVVVYCS